MPSLQSLQKTITKLKNQLLTATNYLELQTTINLFNDVKLKYTQGQGKKKKGAVEDSSETELKLKLIQTTQELIREKIKYFKKLALKKIQSSKKNQADKSFGQEESAKKQRSSKRQFSNLESNITVVNKKKPKQSLPTFFGSKQLKQLKALQDKTLLLQRTLNTSNEKPKRSASKSEKKLKQSKSADNFFSDKLKDSFTFRNDQQSEKKSKKIRAEDRILQNQDNNLVYEMDDDDKTQIRVFNKKGKPYNFNNEQDLQYFKGRVQFLQRVMASSTYANPSAILNDNKHLFDQYHYKLRQKTLQLQQVRNRLQFYQTSTQQLRNRLQNEQRRHEDYIQSLKQHIKRQEAQIFTYQREKKVMGELIREYEGKLEGQEREKVKYIEQIEVMLKEKEREKLSEKAKGQELRLQLQVMAKQEGHLRQLEQFLQKQRLQRNIITSKNTLLKQQLQSLSSTLSTVSSQKQLLQELLQIKLQQIQNYKVQLLQLKRHSNEIQNEMGQMRQQIEQMKKEQIQEEKNKEKQLKKKVEKLKEVRGLLVGEGAVETA